MKIDKKNILNFINIFMVLNFLFFGLTSCMKKNDSSKKILNIVVKAEIKGFDPIFGNDKYSSDEIGRVYEGLLEYHYLKRPYVLVPNLAESMPVISNNGMTYTIKVKKGVYFHDDIAFPAGKGRELVAEDFVYSLKRLANPKSRGLGWWVLDGKLKGFKEWRKRISETAKVDYAEEVLGARALDKYTIEFNLSRPFPQFLYSLAMSFTFVVAKEVVDKYGAEFINHPVGTGPYLLPVFKQNQKIVYSKNPNYREKYYPSDASAEFVKKGFLKDAGKRLPLVDNITVHIMVEAQTRWLNFQKGRVDFLTIPKDNFDSAITPSKNLTDKFKSKGISLLITPSMDLTYTGFNHSLKLFQNLKLRQAMAMAYDNETANKIFYNSIALAAESIVPPGLAGNIKGYKSPYRGPKVERAKELLKEAGYPDGKGLPEITYDSSSSTINRQMGEYFKKRMALLGINIKVQQSPWPKFNEMLSKKKVMIFSIAWGADYPDAETFLQLLYGPNHAPGANSSNFSNAEYDKLFKEASIMQVSPERTAKYEKLNKMAAELAPLVYGVHRQNFSLTHKWIRNYIFADFSAGQGKYLNIDFDLKKKTLSKF